MASGAEVAARVQAELKEIGGNNNKYTHWYSDNVENIGYNFWWCAAFVTYVVRQCGVPTDVVPNYASCSVCIKWARSNGRLRTKTQVKSGEYTPKPGGTSSFGRDIPASSFQSARAASPRSRAIPAARPTAGRWAATASPLTVSITSTSLNPTIPTSRRPF